MKKKRQLNQMQMQLQKQKQKNEIEKKKQFDQQQQQQIIYILATTIEKKLFIFQNKFMTIKYHSESLNQFKQWN